MILVSLAEFLNTGRLGPLAPGIDLNAVARALGPPKGWRVEDDEPVPHYWEYGRHLEIAFRFDDRPRCNWFQLENAASLSEDAAPISDDFVLALDGLSGRSPLSRFVSAIREIDRVEVCLFDLTRSCYPTVLVDTVEIIFDCDRNTYNASTPLDQTIAIIETHARPDSIYSYTMDSQLEHRHNQFRSVPGSTILSGRDYLARVLASQSTSAPSSG